MSEELRDRVAGALEGSAEDVLAAHRALTAALDADPDDAELRRIHRELVDRGAIARLRALERVRAAIGRLADAGPVSEIIDRAPAEAAAALELDRVLLSRIDDGWLVAEALHCEGDAKAATQTLARLRDAPVQIGYPLIEGELLRRRRAAVVTAADGEPESRQANWEIMRWSAYVVAPVLMEGRVVGFLHGDRAGGGAPLRALARAGAPRCARSSGRACGASARASARSTSAPSCAGACASSARSCGASPAGPTGAAPSSPTARSTSPATASWLTPRRAAARPPRARRCTTC